MQHGSQSLSIAVIHDLCTRDTENTLCSPNTLLLLQNCAIINLPCNILVWGHIVCVIQITCTIMCMAFMHAFAKYAANKPNAAFMKIKN